ncbi:LLM class flavin-dependent oxidoreductase [Plantibacter sp. Mn2098]|uniref:LLM class flavin-dependent oxidoreductase n=1 Tax=Plantibacter sp. Mn2098 TaxID=3395266 RepID=UPI003BED1255
MPDATSPLQHLGVLTLGRFDPADPVRGHESAIWLFEQAEELGFDSAWLRQRHLETAISSPLSVIAAASRSTKRIALGTAVIPLGGENPFRLAEDFHTVDLLTHGRLNPGFSVGTPMNWEYYKEAMYPASWESEDLTHARAERLLQLLRDPLVYQDEIGGELSTRTIQPHSAGLVDRVWYGAGSTRSATWGARQGLNLLTSNVVRSHDGDLDFARNMAAVIRAYLDAHPDPASARISGGLVIIPTDGATPSQLAKYRAYVEERDARAAKAWGPGQNLFQRDFIGTSAEIVERLQNDPGFALVTDTAFALPFPFDDEDYAQILGDIRHHVGPALGWTPAE